MGIGLAHAKAGMAISAALVLDYINNQLGNGLTRHLRTIKGFSFLGEGVGGVAVLIIEPGQS